MTTDQPQRIGLRRSWPLWSCTLVYLLVISVQLWIITVRHHDQQIYALDDPYIHAAVAKNLLLHHVYGVTQYQTSFPSSSILWPLLLAAAFAVVGVHGWVMFALNTILALIYLTAAYLFVLEHAPSLPRSLQAVLLLLLIFAVPLQLLTFIAMEHILHALIFLLLLWTYSKILKPHPTHKTLTLFLISALLITAVRYEGLFAVTIVCALLALHRRWRLAVATALAAAIPPVLFGLFSLHNGSTFLPSPLLLKTAETHQPWYLAAAHNLLSRPSLTGGILLVLLLSLAAVLLLRHQHRHSHPLFDWLIIFSGAFLLHAQFARFGWLFRYEAYLLATGLILLFTAIPLLKLQSPKLSFWFLALLIAGIAGRAIVLLPLPITQAHLVAEQQYQTALFLRRFYSGQSVALNDIGAPNFFADIHCLDLYGLSSPQVQRLRAEGQFSRQTMERLATGANVGIAILYEESFTGMIPPAWTAVSRWTITDMPATSLFGPATITFYAVGPEQSQRLNRQIRAFEPGLPPTIHTTNLIAKQEPQP